MKQNKVSHYISAVLFSHSADLTDAQVGQSGERPFLISVPTRYFGVETLPETSIGIGKIPLPTNELNKEEISGELAEVKCGESSEFAESSFFGINVNPLRCAGCRVCQSYESRYINAENSITGLWLL